MTDISQVPPEHPEYDIRDIVEAEDPGEPSPDDIADDYSTEEVAS